MYGYWIHPQGGATDLYLLYEYPVNDNVLNSLIRDEKRRALTAKRRIKILYEVARALSFLHKGNITDGTTKYTFVHRDIKAGSIYLAADYTAKLMDCGVSKFVEDPTSKFDTTSVKMSFPLMEDLKVIGTPGYCCPSYASGKMLCYDASCDLYSFGIVMIELITGWPQFGQSNIRSCNQNLIRKYYDKSVLLSALDELAGDGWNHVADDLCECALSCVKLDHRERPSTEEVFERLSDVYTRFVLSPTTSPTK
jgi:serine/threonine protein kinase